MEQNQQKTGLIAIKEFLNSKGVSEKFKELLGKRSTGFITSVLQTVSSNKLLSNADPASVYQSAAVAAILDLPLNNNLGFAYIVPYNEKVEGGGTRQVAQFQMGYKGFIQLAQRSGQFSTINATDVREGEIKSWNRLTGEIQFDWIQDPAERLKKQVVGYASYFRLLNGFEKLHYLTVDELKAHGTRYSQTFKKGFGLWKDDFDAMALKTVLKLNLSKYAPMSVEMQTAIVADQAVIKNAETQEVEYVDADAVEVDKEAERVKALLADAKDINSLNKLRDTIPAEQMGLFDERMKQLVG